MEISITSNNFSQTGTINNICGKCGKVANPYTIMPDKKIYCLDCYNEINCPDIKDPLLKNCYDTFLSVSKALDSCMILLDREFGYKTTASGVAYEQIQKIRNLLEVIREHEKVQS